jgi:hypothetical protein
LSKLLLFSTKKQASDIACLLETGLAGFEPAHHGVKVRCLTAWL